MNTFQLSVFAFLWAILLSAGSAYAGYAVPESFLHPGMVAEIGSAAYPTGESDDSETFQKAIDSVNAAGGGHVLVPAGVYRLLGVEMKSDVQLIFQSGVTIRPAEGKGANIFEFGKTGLIRNASLIGPENSVHFDFTGLPKDTKIRAVAVSDCDNFRVANLTTDDSRTVFSTIILGWDGVRDGVAKIARNGLIENVTANDAHYGYGAIQAHSGENIVFRNIKSVGGVAVRLETGLKPMNESGIGGLFNILVEEVTSVNGQAALMLQSHTLLHGDVVARNIRSDGSEFAVYIAKGFVSNARYGPDSKKEAGRFKSITIDGVKAIYRDGPIITRFVHLRYYPEELQEKLTRVEEGTEPGYRGPSIAAVANMVAGDSTVVTVKNVEAIGFTYRPDIITPKDIFQGKLKDLKK